ncbi:MAG: hypothetical protein WCO24_00180 [Actinomycetes bacterium]
MFEWSFAAAAVVFLVTTFLQLALVLIKSRSTRISLLAIGVVELVAIANLVLGVFLVGSGQEAKTSTIEYFFYAGFALLVPLAAITFTLIERNRFSFYVYALASFTLFVMVLRMRQIWFGA